MRLDPRAEEQDGEGGTIDPDRLEGIRVLIVDDHDANRRILTEACRGWHMVPESCATADEAWMLLCEEQEAAEHDRETLARGETDPHAPPARATTPFSLLLTDANLRETDGLELIERLRADHRFAELPIVLLSSGSRPGDSERAARAGVAARMLKPIKQSELLETMIRVLEPRRVRGARNAVAAAATERGESVEKETGSRAGANEEREATKRDDERSPSLAAGTRSLDLLVVEDNPVNRKLAVRLLEKEGHVVSVARHGLEALEAAERREFDAIVMDVQMPVMDGLTATRRIREMEESLHRRTPIIGLTAHAMSGDRRKCLDAGMDQYVTKPIRIAELREALDEAVGASLRRRAAGRAGSSDEVAVDWSSALETVGGDRKLLGELIELFELDSQKLLGELSRAVRAEDSAEVLRTSHSLKGALRHLGCRSAADVAWEIEQRGEQQEVRGLEPKIAELEALTFRSLERLQQLHRER